MRTLVIAAVMAIGVGFAGAPASAAMPASGTVIGHAVKSGAVVEQARWWRRHHHRRHCWWHRGHLRCGW